MSKLLIVGLGNIPYPLTRHSVGHLVVDSLAERFGLRLASNRSLDGYVAKGEAQLGEKSVGVTLFKPKPLMNITGKSVAAALRASVVQPSQMVVIQDSLSHRPGTLSPKFGGSANGHNGVKSVIAALGGNMDFYRLRVGIGRPEDNVVEYVLGRLSSYEKTFWGADGEGIELVLRELEKIAANPKTPR